MRRNRAGFPGGAIIAQTLILMILWQTLVLPWVSPTFAAATDPRTGLEGAVRPVRRPALPPSLVKGVQVNQPPAVDAGPDQTIRINQVATLVGDVSDDGLPLGATLHHEWRQVSGPASVVFGDPAQPQTTATFSAVGTYVLALRATDSELESLDEITIEVRPEVDPNTPPTVSAGPDLTLLVTETASLAGTATDDGLPAGSSLAITWTQASGPGVVTFANPNQAATTATFETPGTYVLRLAASDGEATGFDETTITVNPANGNLPPVVSAGPDQTLRLGNNLLVNPGAEVPSPNASPIGWVPVTGTWTQVEAGVAGAPPAIEGSQVFKGELTTVGLIEYRYDIRSLIGVSGTLEVSGIGWLDGYRAAENPVLNISYEFQTASGVQAGTGSGPFIFLGDARWDQVIGSIPIPTSTLITTLILRYRFNRSAPLQPTTVFLDAAGLRCVTRGVAQLNGSATDDGQPAGGQVTTNWTQVSGPGSVSFKPNSSAPTQAIFPQAGTYVLRMSGSDGQLSSADDLTITVLPANQRPIVTAGPTQIVKSPTGLVEIDVTGTASDDGRPEGNVLQTDWSCPKNPARAVIAQPELLTTRVILEGVGVFDLQLRASDGDLVHLAHTTVTVTNNNTAPSLELGSNRVLTQPNTALDLPIRIIDNGANAGEQYQVSWNVDSGPGGVTFGPTAFGVPTTGVLPSGKPSVTAITEATFTELGSYVLRVTVSDGELSTTGTINVTYRAGTGNQPPVVTINPPGGSASLNTLLTLTGSALDDGQPAGSQLSYQWRQVSGPGPVGFGTPTTPTTTVSLTQAGTYVVRLTVSDGELFGIAEVTLTAGCEVIQALDVMLLMDTSISMMVNLDGYPWNAFVDAKVIAEGIVNGLRPGIDQIGLARYNATGLPVTPLGYDKEAVLAGLNGLTSDASASYIYGGMTICQQELLGTRRNPNAIPIMIILADGRFPYEAAIPDAVKAAGIRVVTIGLGWSGEPVAGWSGLPADVMRRIASTNGDAWFLDYYQPSLQPDQIVREIMSRQCVVNFPPVVRVQGTPNLVYLPQTMAVTGTVTDDGLLGGVTLAWEASGPGPVVFSPGNQLSSTASFSVAGEYVLTLLAFDGEWTSRATVKVRVVDPTTPNQPPTVSAGEGLTVVMNGNLASNPGNEAPLVNGRITDWILKSGDWRKSPGTPNMPLPYAGSDFFVVENALSPQLIKDFDLRALPLSLRQTTGYITGGYGKLLNDQGLTGVMYPFYELLNQNGSSVASGDLFGSASLMAGRWNRMQTNEVFKGALPGIATTLRVNLNFQESATLPNGFLLDGFFIRCVQPAPAIAYLNGVVTDDWLPAGSTVTRVWSKVSGPGTVLFADASQAKTTASFSEPGEYVLQLSATDGQATTTRTVTVTVNPEPVIAIGPETLGDATRGSAYTQTLVGSGGTGPYWFERTGSTPVPPGLTIQGDGRITGVPTARGVYTFSVKAYDLDGFVTTRQYTMQVVEPGTNTAPTVNAGADKTLPYTPNLVQNPGAEQGTATQTPSWQATVANTWGQITGGVNGLPVAAEGTRYFGPTTSAGTTVELRQGVTVADQAAAIDAGRQEFVISAKIRSGSEAVPDTGQLVVEFLSQGLSVLASVTTGEIGVAAGWAPVVVKHQAPPTTRSIRLRLIANRRSGPTTDVWFDDLKVVPDGFSGVTIFGGVADDGRPVGIVTSQWEKISGPGEVLFKFPTQGATQMSFSRIGTYVLRLTGNDTQLTGSDDVTVKVTGPNQAPVVNAGADQAINFPNTATLTGTVLDDGQPENAPVSASWTQVAGPGTATFDTASSLTPTVTFSAPGVYVLRLTATDTALTGSDEIKVVVASESGNLPPTVDAGPDRELFDPTAAIQLEATVADDNLPNPTPTVTWSKVSGPGAVTFSNPATVDVAVSFSEPGVYVLQLSATDGELTTTDQVTVNVITVEITSPADGGDVTAPMEIRGTVSTATWKLEYSLNTEDGEGTQNWITLAEGSGPLTNGVLGTLDPTLLLNGSYSLRLTGTQGTTLLSDQIAVIVDKNMKIGNFTVSFSDVNVPVAGLPIEVIRTYDSRDKQKGDFGVGWTLSVKNIRVEKTGVIGKNWVEEVQTVFIGGNPFPEFDLKPLRSASVTLTFPNGKVMRFRPVVTPAHQFGAPIQYVNVSFQPEPGSYGKLRALSPTGQELEFSETLVTGTPPEPIPGGFNSSRVEVTDLATLRPFNPTKFKYTDDSGVVFTIDQKLGVTRIDEPNGNFVTFTSGGIQHSTGKSLVFQRDSEGRITQITDPNGAAMTYGYDANGDLVSFTDREAETTTFEYLGTTHYLLKIKDPRQITPITNEYDPTGRLIRHVDGFGKEIGYVHDIPGRRETITDRLGNPTVYEYDGSGNVTRKTTADGAVTQYTYDSRDNQLTETNALGKVTTMTYDANDNKLTDVDPLGNTTRYTYNAQRKMLTITDPKGNVTTNTYDTKGNLLTTRDALGKVTTYTYTGGGLVSTVTDALNHTSSYGYDGAGNLTQETDALGHISTHTYDANGNRKTSTVTRTKPGGGTETLTTVYTYDNLNRVTRSTYPDGTFTETIYNKIGKVAVSKDQLGRQTSYTYDTMGQLTRTTYPDGSFEESTYDDEGRRLTSKDRAGRVTSYDYDVVGRLKKTTAPDGSVTESTYDLLGRVLTSKDALGQVTTYEYDPNCGCAGRRTKVIDALGRATNFAFDENGNQTTMTDAKGHTMSSVYDVLNRRTRTVFHDGTYRETTYDDIGRRTAERDQDGKVTRFEYDALGRLVKVIDALNQETRYQYNEIGQQTAQIDALNRTTRYEYDQMGRRTRRILPMGQTETYDYNDLGNLLSRRDFNGRTTTYQYDQLNRLTQVVPDTFFSAPPISYTYNVLGQRLTMTDASGTTSYGYDSRNRLTSKTTPQGTLTYTYNAVGNLLTAKSAATNGVDVEYSYDVLNRLETLTDNRLGTTQNVTSYGYDQVGNLETVTLPNGVESTYSYDVLNRLTNLTARNAGNTPVASYAYTLGAAGNRLSVAELSGRTTSWTYDALYRLTSETIAGATASQNGSLSYTFDAVGNRTNRTSTVAAVPTQTNVQVDNNDRLTSDTYDDNGNTTVSNGKTYTYDFMNRLLKVEGGSTTIDIVYDGDGNRVSKTVTSGDTSVTTKFLVDTNNHTGYAQVVEEVQNGSVVRQYTFGHDLISQRQEIAGNWAVHFYGYDGHGSTRYLTDVNGTVTDTYDYDAFGNLIGQTGNTPNLYRYCGEQFDPDLGLYFLRARYLDVNSGRFWSMDEFGGLQYDPTTLHKYTYAHSRPVDYSDPSGYSPLTELVATVNTISWSVFLFVAPALEAAAPYLAALNIYLFFTNEDYRYLMIATSGNPIELAGFLTAQIGLLAETGISIGLTIQKVSGTIYGEGFGVNYALEGNILKANQGEMGILDSTGLPEGTNMILRVRTALINKAKELGATSIEFTTSPIVQDTANLAKGQGNLKEYCDFLVSEQRAIMHPPPIPGGPPKYTLIWPLRGKR